VVGMLGLLSCVSAAISFCICNEDVMCHWFRKGVGVVSEYLRFECAWRCSSARIGTYSIVHLYITIYRQGVVLGPSYHCQLCGVCVPQF